MINVILVVQVGGVIMTVDSSFDPAHSEDMSIDVPKTFWDDAGIDGPPSDGWWIGTVSFHTTGPDMEGDYDTDASVVWRPADTSWLKDGEFFCREAMDNDAASRADAVDSCDLMLVEAGLSKAVRVARWRPDFEEAMARDPEPAPWEKP